MSTNTQGVVYTFALIISRLQKHLEIKSRGVPQTLLHVDLKNVKNGQANVEIIIPNPVVFQSKAYEVGRLRLKTVVEVEVEVWLIR